MILKQWLRRLPDGVEVALTLLVAFGANAMARRPRSTSVRRVVGVLGIVPMALLFAYWYAHTRRLWPLIVAHAILDLVGLAVQMR